MKRKKKAGKLHKEIQQSTNFKVENQQTKFDYTLIKIEQTHLIKIIHT